MVLYEDYIIPIFFLIWKLWETIWFSKIFLLNRYILENIRHNSLLVCLIVSKVRHQKSEQSLLKNKTKTKIHHPNKQTNTNKKKPQQITTSFCHLWHFKALHTAPCSFLCLWLNRGPLGREKNIQQMSRRMEICSSLVSHFSQTKGNTHGKSILPVLWHSKNRT